jgi:predicted nucleic acid-binding protein
MKVVLDTNVILDAVLEQADYKPAQALLMAVATEKISGIITANSITDIYYVARKMMGDQDARRAISRILDLFDVAPVDGEACATALNLPMNDYEDAVLAACASREEADYIATSDRGFMKSDSPVPARATADILKMLEE